MAGVQDNLAAEVARIVTCPYPTQLQVCIYKHGGANHFHDITDQIRL